MITQIASSYKEYSQDIKPWDENSVDISHKWFRKAKCPSCKAEGQFRNHGYYERTCLYYEDGEWKSERMHVLRGYCKSCKHTHAILPADLIPYRCMRLCDYLKLLLSIYFYCSQEDVVITDLPIRESLLDDESFDQPLTVKSYYSLLTLFRYFLNYLLDVLRQLDLWDKSSNPDEATVIILLLQSADLQKAQQKMLELHLIPLFFRRNRTADGCPWTGMLENG